MDHWTDWLLNIGDIWLHQVDGQRKSCWTSCVSGMPPTDPNWDPWQGLQPQSGTCLWTTSFSLFWPAHLWKPSLMPACWPSRWSSWPSPTLTANSNSPPSLQTWLGKGGQKAALEIFAHSHYWLKSHEFVHVCSLSRSIYYFNAARKSVESETFWTNPHHYSKTMFAPEGEAPNQECLFKSSAHVMTWL